MHVCVLISHSLKLKFKSAPPHGIYVTAKPIPRNIFKVTARRHTRRNSMTKVNQSGFYDGAVRPGGSYA